MILVYKNTKGLNFYNLGQNNLFDFINYFKWSIIYSRSFNYFSWHVLEDSMELIWQQCSKLTSGLKLLLNIFIYFSFSGIIFARLSTADISSNIMFCFHCSFYDHGSLTIQNVLLWTVRGKDQLKLVVSADIIGLIIFYFFTLVSGISMHINW